MNKYYSMLSTIMSEGRLQTNKKGSIKYLTNQVLHLTPADLLDIFEMDADFSHDPADLPRLYSACHDEGYDVAIGSRYVSGVNVVNWPIGRVLMSYFASKYVRMVTGFKVHDTTAGFKC